MNEVLINQLLSLRAQAEALTTQIEAAIALAAAEQPQECQHPPDQRVDFSTMGRSCWQCKVCGYLHEEVK